MIVEDLVLYVAKILHDHGNHAVARAFWLPCTGLV